MIANIKSWLSTHYRISEADVETYFRNEDVTGFLIIWTIFEQKLFKGFTTRKEVDSYDYIKSQEIVCKLEDEFNHFFSVYQKETRFKNLIHSEKSVEKIKNILSSEKDELSKEDRLRLLIFVVYRYRNNIFHGNKPVQSWLQYKPEIIFCVNVMKTLLEFNSKAESTESI